MTTMKLKDGYLSKPHLSTDTAQHRAAHDHHNSRKQRDKRAGDRAIRVWAHFEVFSLVWQHFLFYIHVPYTPRTPMPCFYSNFHSPCPMVIFASYCVNNRAICPGFTCCCFAFVHRLCVHAIHRRKVSVSLPPVFHFHRRFCLRFIVGGPHASPCIRKNANKERDGWRAKMGIEKKTEQTKQEETVHFGAGRAIGVHSHKIACFSLSPSLSLVCPPLLCLSLYYGFHNLSFHLSALKHSLIHARTDAKFGFDGPPSICCGIGLTTFFQWP